MDRLESVRNLMSVPVLSVQIDATLDEVWRMMKDRPFHHIPVLKGEALAGIVSALDIARFSLESCFMDPGAVEDYLSQFSMEQVMTLEPETLSPHDTIARAAELLSEGSYHALPVVDSRGHLVGILTSTDLIRYLAKHY